VLEITVDNAAITGVTCDGTPIRELSEMKLSSEKTLPADYVGEFGIVVADGAAVFRNFEFCTLKKGQP
jgi:hypothetical protein